jgi:hypothetical protein
VRNGGTFLRRLEKLESAMNVLSTEDKWKRIHDRALELMSDEDLDVLEEIAELQKASKVVEQTPARVAAIATSDDNFWITMRKVKVRFTVPEMDQLLAEG